MRAEKKILEEFYNKFGWLKNEEGLYKDTLTFVDRRSVLQEYHRKIHLRVKKFLKPSGRFFLDAASGAIPHPEYLEYSSGYEKRVCIDLSVRALNEARLKLENRGLYLLADITRLPFRDSVFEGIVSAHTIYHVPKDEQILAIRELERTLRPGSSSVIVYCWQSCFIMKFTDAYRKFRRNVLRLPRRAFSKLRRLIFRTDSRPQASQQSGVQDKEVHPPLYFHAFDYQWFQQSLPTDWDTEIRCWSSVDTDFSKTLVPDNGFGRVLLRLIFWLEDVFPHAFARIGKYPMIINRKRA